MSRCYLQLFGYGDICCILPLCLGDFKREGIKPLFMVHKDYKEILDGVTYVNPVVWDGDKRDIEGALKKAKEITQDVICTQVVGRNVKSLVYGIDTPTLDSYERQMWLAADRLKDWKLQLPLVFDNRSKAREEKLIKSIKNQLTKPRTILCSTSGVSSPFPHKELLYELLKLKFYRSYNIVSLDEVRGEKIYDLLGIFEASDFLVATDSALLHLAYAVSLPTVALIADTPSLWHGSAYRANHIDHIRYSQFPKYCLGMLEAMLKCGKEGSRFWDKLPPKNRNIFLHHGRSDFVLPDDGTWVDVDIPIGAFSRTIGGMPYLKDLLRLGALHAGDTDIIHLSNSVSFTRQDIWNNINSLSDKPYNPKEIEI